MRRFFCTSTTYVLIDGLENNYNFMQFFFFWFNCAHGDGQADQCLMENPVKQKFSA